MCAHSIGSCDIDFRSEIGDVLLCGGSASLPGLSKRLTHDMAELVSRFAALQASPAKFWSSTGDPIPPVPKDIAVEV